MSLILNESTYATEMQQTVTPFLAAHGTERYVEREEGRKLYVVIYRADRPRGLVMVSHGFTENAEKYKELLYYFVKMQYHVCMVEHCGHGRSYRLTEDPSLVHVDSWERYVEDFLYVTHLAQKAQPELPLYLYGHSMGGGIAAAAAAKEPDLFEKVILSSPMIRPQTGDVPWKTAQQIAAHFCRTGRAMRYVIGQRSYEGGGSFEESCGISRARFDYYRQKEHLNQCFQLSAASYGWLREAGALNHYLQHSGWKKIKAPILLFQAEKELLVSKREQERFIRKLYRRGISPQAALIRVPGTKHEIFNSSGHVLEQYWRQVFRFLAEGKS